MRTKDSSIQEEVNAILANLPSEYPSLYDAKPYCVYEGVVDAITSLVEEKRKLAINNKFKIGSGNTYQQAFAAALCGNQVRMPTWPPDQSWIFERTHQELLRVYGDTLGEWELSGVVVCPTGAHQLSTEWIVLPLITDPEPITV